MKYRTIHTSTFSLHNAEIHAEAEIKESTEEKVHSPVYLIHRYSYIQITEGNGFEMTGARLPRKRYMAEEFSATSYRSTNAPRNPSRAPRSR